MTEPRFTPGPRRIVEGPPNGGFPEAEGWPIVRIGKFWVMSPPLHGDRYGNDEADALLDAAAPDLYAALKSLVDFEMRLQSGPATAKRWGNALKALAKAVPHD